MTNQVTRIKYCQDQLRKARKDNNEFLVMLYEQELESRLNSLNELRALVD